MPRKNPEAIFAQPCATKSWFASALVPSGLGADSATPAPCTSTMAATEKAPASNVRRNNVPARYSTGTAWSADAAANAAALVVVMTISFVLWVKPPTIGPMKLAYSPKIGLIPTRDTAAIPSGTEAAARGRPAIASSLIDSGRIECHQERSLPGEERQLVLEAAERGLVGEYVNDDHADGRQSDENQMCRRHALHGVPRSPVSAELREHNDEHKDQYPDGQDRCDDLLLTEFRLHLSRFGEHRFRHRVSALRSRRFTTHHHATPSANAAYASVGGTAP